MELLDQLLESIDQLPTIPAVAIKISQLIAAGENTAGELEAMIKQDDGLASTVLRVANSARQRLSSK